MAEITIHPIAMALLAGALPAFLWLWFWLKEDSAHPEPKRLIASAFLAGILTIPIVLALERAVYLVLPQGLPLIAAWAFIEEIVKYLAAYYIAFRVVCVDGSKCLDEPIDPFIYLMTVALGFAAVENTLFLIEPFSNGQTTVGLITGNLRFVGATVLHVAASSLVGIAMGLSFYKSKRVKRFAVTVGLFTAVVLHTLFNLSIINNNNADSIFITFGFLWAFALFLILFFEKVKRTRRT